MAARGQSTVRDQPPGLKDPKILYARRAADLADLVSSRIEAIEWIERQAYDVVLMEVRMPEIDGLEALRRITTNGPADKGPRIVAMTASATQGDHGFGLAARAGDHVAKAILGLTLVDALKRASTKTGVPT